MIDYRNLHSKIKAALKPDSPMPEGYILWAPIPNSNTDYIAVKYVDGFPVNGCPCFTFNTDFAGTPPASIEWFAEALGIPLEDNGYTDLVKAAELVIKINTAFRSGVDLEEWAESANDGEIDLGAALERIKSENP